MCNSAKFCNSLVLNYSIGIQLNEPLIGIQQKKVADNNLFLIIFVAVFHCYVNNLYSKYL